MFGKHRNCGKSATRETTVHTGLGLPLKLTKDSSLILNNRFAWADKLRAARVILWDGVPMSLATALKVAGAPLREMVGNNQLFGGKIMVLVGDFRRVLLVIPHGSRA